MLLTLALALTAQAAPAPELPTRDARAYLDELAEEIIATEDTHQHVLLAALAQRRDAGGSVFWF